PHWASLFARPGSGPALGFNGRAAIVRDRDVLSQLAARGKEPRIAMGVEVEEAYLHCPKAFIRSSLWDPSTWPDPKQLPSFAQMLWDQIPSAHGGASTLQDYERDLDQRVRDTLY